MDLEEKELRSFMDNRLADGILQVRRGLVQVKPFSSEDAPCPLTFDPIFQLDFALFFSYILIIKKEIHFVCSVFGLKAFETRKS